MASSKKAGSSVNVSNVGDVSILSDVGPSKLDVSARQKCADSAKKRTLRENNDAFARELNILKKKNRELERELKRAKDEAEFRSQENEELKFENQELRTVEEKSRALARELTTSKDEIEELRRQNVELKSEIQELRAQLAAANSAARLDEPVSTSGREGTPEYGDSGEGARDAANEPQRVVDEPSREDTPDYGDQDSDGGDAINETSRHNVAVVDEDGSPESAEGAHDDDDTAPTARITRSSAKKTTAVGQRGGRAGPSTSKTGKRDQIFESSAAIKRFNERCRQLWTRYRNGKQIYCRACNRWRVIHRLSVFINHMRVHASDTSFMCNNCKWRGKTEKTARCHVKQPHNGRGVNIKIIDDEAHLKKLVDEFEKVFGEKDNAPPQSTQSTKRRVLMGLSRSTGMFTIGIRDRIGDIIAKNADPEVQCNVCNRRFSCKTAQGDCNKHFVLEHVLRHAKLPVYGCRKCGFKAATQHKVCYHLVKAHGVGQKGNYSCNDGPYETQIMAQIDRCFGGNR